MPICLIIDHVFPQNLWRLVLFASQCLVYGISFSLDDALHFLCLREIEHTDVIWQDWNICCISALACLISSTCLSTCTLDAVVFRVLFLWCIFSLLTFVCVSVSPGEVDDVLDSICIVHYSRDGHRPAPIMVSQELFVIGTLVPN